MNQMGKDPKVFVVSGPSGAGKGTLTAELLKRVPSLTRSVSATTRKPRPGEIDGIDYHFLSQEAFKDHIERDEFLEWAVVHNNYYGTLRSTIEKELAEGRDVILVIDVQGALNVRKKIPGAVLIFIEPPSVDDLIKRLELRNTESEAELACRLKNAQHEMMLAKEYDYVVINDEINRAVNELVRIVEAQRKQN